jgi:hypothetical protein
MSDEPKDKGVAWLDALLEQANTKGGPTSEDIAAANSREMRRHAVVSRIAPATSRRLPTR